MKQEILAAASGTAITHPQGGTLFRLSGLKFWEPENLPMPTNRQASILIGGFIAYNKKETQFEHKDYSTQEVTVLSNRDILECIQLFFPSIESMKEVKPKFFKSHKATPQEARTEPGTTPEPKPGSQAKPESTHEPEQPAPKPKPEPKPKQEPKRETKPVTTEDAGQTSILNLIQAGIRNIWLVGPAGCGKTTLCQLSGKELELPVTVIPCGAGTSATTFLGYKYPEREGTPFVHAFSLAGIIVLDEFTALEAQVAQIVNGALANNELTSTTGTANRHPDCTIIATSNTFGNGGDRQYVANNQLDASTIDRFAGGVLQINYSTEYESQYDNEVCRYVWHLRDVINKNGLRKIASTRSIINACLLKQGGINWKEALTQNWTKDEKALL